MSRSGRRKGRPYQPLPDRRSGWVARLVVVVIGVILLFGSLAFVAGLR